MKRESTETDSTARLTMTENGLALTRGTLSLCADFTKMLPRLKPSNLNRELLVRASRIKGLEGEMTAIDATAGLGEDSLLLAAAGYRVTMYENDPVIAAMLSDALNRAMQNPVLSPVASRMRLIAGDSIPAMRSFESRQNGDSAPAIMSFESRQNGDSAPAIISFESRQNGDSAPAIMSFESRQNGDAAVLPPDLIYLDPMFPERKKSGLIKKKFQLLHELETPCCNEEELLFAALSANPKRIVIKRPVKESYLAGRKPDFSYKGAQIRYDCIIP